jgi:hypothetical protein
MQTDAQKLVVVRDQFALKGLSDDALKQILPAYQEAFRRLQWLLANLPPEGESIARELWLRTQLATIEAQFKPVADRIYQILPEAQARAFEEGLTNAQKYLEAGGITPQPAQQTTLTGVTAGGQQVSVTGNLPGFNLTSAVEKGFISPSITRQQIVAAARETGFSVLSPGGSKYGLSELLPNWMAAQSKQVERHLRAGFLVGSTNDEIMREIGPLGPGRKGWAMTEAVVRTSMAEASQSAHDAFYEANADLLPGTKSGYRWWWDASNDTRLCPLCAPLDGVKFKERKDPPKPWPRHFSCRCKLLPWTATQELLEEEDGPASGSFLEATPVQYDRRGKRKDPPAGYTGENAYKRPMKIDGQQQWVRRRDLGPGQTTAGDMLQNANEHSKRMVLGKHTDAFNTLTGKGGKYEKDPQGAVRKLLGDPLPPGATEPRPIRGPAPKPAPPAPKAKAAPKPKAEPKAAPMVDVSQMRRAKPGGEYGPDGHWYPGGAFISDGKYQGVDEIAIGKGDGGLLNGKDDKGKNGEVGPTVVRNRKTEEPRPMRPTAATGLEKPSGMKKLLEKRDREYFTEDGFLTEEIERAATKAGDGRSPLENTGFMTALVNRAKPEWVENKIAAIRKVVSDVADFDYYVQDARDSAAYEYALLKRGATTASEAEYAAGQGLLQAVFQLAGERRGRKKGGSRTRSVNEDVIWIMNNVLMTKRRR